jgi:hypothetical protein
MGIRKDVPMKVKGFFAVGGDDGKVASSSWRLSVEAHRERSGGSD